MRHPGLIAAMGTALLCLSACSGSEDASAPVSDDPAATPAGPAPAPDTPGKADATPADTIPAIVRGGWGINPADCDVSSGAAKGNLQIADKTVTFYEAVATLGTIESRTPDTIRAQFTFEGEGEKWTQGMDLAVQDGGQTLVRRDFGQDAMPEPLTYKRCD